MARSISQFLLILMIGTLALIPANAQEVHRTHVEPAWQLASLETVPLAYSNDGHSYLINTAKGEVAVHDVTNLRVLFQRTAKLLYVDKRRETFWLPGQYAIEEYSYRTGELLDSIPCPTWPQSVGVQHDGAKILLSDYSTLYVYDRNTGIWDTVITGLDVAFAGFVHRDLPLIAWVQYAPKNTPYYEPRTFNLHLYWTDSSRHDSIPADGLVAEDWGSNYVKNGHYVVDLHTLRKHYGACTPDQRYMLTPVKYGGLDLLDLSSGDTIAKKLASGWDEEVPEIALALGDTVYFFQGETPFETMFCWSVSDSTMRTVRDPFAASYGKRGMYGYRLHYGYRNDSVIIGGIERHILVPSMVDVTPTLLPTPRIYHQFTSDGSLLIGGTQFNVITSSGSLAYKPITGSSRGNLVGLISERPQLLTVYTDTVPDTHLYTVFQYGDPPTRSDTVHTVTHLDWENGYYDMVLSPGDTTILCGRREIQSPDQMFGPCTVKPSLDRWVFDDAVTTRQRDTVYGLTRFGLEQITRGSNDSLSIRYYSGNGSDGQLLFSQLTSRHRSFLKVMRYGALTLELVDGSGLVSDAMNWRLRRSAGDGTYASAALHGSTKTFIVTKVLDLYSEVVHEILDDTLGVVERISGPIDTVVAWLEDTTVVARKNNVLHRRGLHGAILNTWTPGMRIRDLWRPDNSSSLMVLTDAVLYSLNSDLSVRDSMTLRVFTDGRPHHATRYRGSDIDSDRVLLRIGITPEPFSTSREYYVLVMADLRSGTTHPILPMFTPFNVGAVGLSQNVYSCFVNYIDASRIYFVVDLTTHKPLAIESYSTWYSGDSTNLNFHKLNSRGHFSPIRRPDLGVLGCILPDEIENYQAPIAISADKKKDLVYSQFTTNGVLWSSFGTRDLATLSIHDEAIMPDSVFRPTNTQWGTGRLITMREDGSGWAGVSVSGDLLCRDAVLGFTFTPRNIGEVQRLLFNITGDTLFCSTMAQGIVALPLPSSEAVSVRPLEHYGACEITCTPVSDRGVRLDALSEDASISIVDAAGREVQYAMTIQAAGHGTACMIDVPSSASTLIMRVQTAQCATYFLLFPDGTIGTPVR